MTFEQQIEKEAYIEILNDLIAEYFRANEDSKFIADFEQELRFSNNYETVIEAKSIIEDAKAILEESRQTR